MIRGNSYPPRRPHPAPTTTLPMSQLSSSDRRRTTEVDMADQPKTFGIELRRMRIAAGLSLTGLGDRLHYSKGHLSKIENGQKAPSVELVRRCDAELGAQGTLIALVPQEPGVAPP